MLRLFVYMFIAIIFNNLTAGKSCAQGVVGMHALSFHSRGGYETVTPGLYFKDPEGKTLGFVRNSEGAFGWYAAKTIESSNKRFSITAGVIMGYSKNFTPLVVPSFVFYRNSSFNARVAYLPKPPNLKGSDAIHFAFEYKVSK